MSTDPLDLEFFQRRVGGVFYVDLPGVALKLELVECSALPAPRMRADGGGWVPMAAPNVRATPFTVLLAGPLTPALPQATYALRPLDAGDTLAIFLVPVRREATAIIYEAVFG